MPVAPTYNRQFSFTNYQAVNPATPLPATPLDNELSSVKVTLDALNANLNLIQRSDGQVANASIGAQQLQPSLLTGISPPTQWSGAGVSYQVGATVFSGLLFYVCNMANVSSTANPPATFVAWTLLADFSGVTIPAGSVTSAAFAPGAVNSAALGANLALPGSPTTGDNSTAIATTAFVDAQASNMLTGYKNRIINSTMAIDQRHSGGAGSTVGYTCDRWKYNATQASKALWQRIAAASAPGFPFNLAINSSGAYTLLSTDIFAVAQAIEAYDCYDLMWGTASAQPVTLSFWALVVTAGTYGGAITNGAGNRSYPFTYALPAGTWTRVSITIPGDLAGTWSSTGNGVGMIVSFNIGAGSGTIGAANAWASGSAVCGPGTTQIIGVAGAIFHLTGVSLQVGPGAVTAPFEFRPVAQELALCQRYYEGQSGDIISMNVSSGFTYQKYSPFAAQKRAAPTITYSAISVSGFSGSIAPAPTISGLQTSALATATGASAVSYVWAADSDY